MQDLAIFSTIVLSKFNVLAMIGVHFSTNGLVLQAQCWSFGAAERNEGTRSAAEGGPAQCVCCVPGTAHVLGNELNSSTIKAVWQVLGPARWRRVGAKRRHEPKARGNEVTGHGVAPVSGQLSLFPMGQRDTGVPCAPPNVSKTGNGIIHDKRHGICRG